MKRFLMSSIAAGMALSMIGAPMAMAENQHGPQNGPQHMQNHGPAPQHSAQHVTMQHVTVQHNTYQHVTVQHQTVQHVTVIHQQSEINRPPPQHYGYDSGRHWHSGDRYDGNRTYVNNWQAYHLQQPPPGYQWVQDGSQFVLIAVASGVITSVILNAIAQ